MDSAPLIVFAGGGSGGHLFPAVALVDHLGRHEPRLRFEFLCTDRPIDTRILEGRRLPFTVQPVRPVPRNPLAAAGFLAHWWQSLALCRRRFTGDRPAVVVGTGGFGSGPAVTVAARLGIPTALLNPDAVPGRANRHLARKATVVFAQWPVTARHFGPGTSVLTTGCPVARAFTEPSGDRGYDRFQLDPESNTLLITGASSGARTLNDAFALLAPELAAEAPGWQVLHIAGVDHCSAMQAAYRRAVMCATVLPFTDHMAAALRCTDLAVGRAGAVTLAELRATGTPALLLPYPFDRHRHQQANAEAHAAGGAAIVMPDLKDPQRNAEALRTTLLPLLSDPTRLQAMRRAAASGASSNAAELVAQQLLALCDTSRSANNSQPV